MRRLILLFAVLISLPARVPAQSKPTLTAADYDRWESFGTTELSPDGKWLAYVITRVDDENELRVRHVSGDSTIVVKYGTRPVFSPNGQWLAYGIGVSQQERERLEAADQQRRGKAGLLDLRTGRQTVIDNVTDYAFSGDSRFVALRGYTAQGRKSSGVDVIVRDLARGIDTNFGNVGSFAWQDKGSLLALIIDAENADANGVRLYDAATGTIRTLASDTAGYTGLVWRKDAADLAVLRVSRDTAHEEAGHDVLAWRGLAGRNPTQRVFAPAQRAGFPPAHRIVEYREPQWSDDGTMLFFGIQPWTRRPEPTPPDTTKPKPKRVDPAGVDVWHADDVDIIPEQKVRAGLEKNRSIPVA